MWRTGREVARELVHRIEKLPFEGDKRKALRYLVQAADVLRANNIGRGEWEENFARALDEALDSLDMRQQAQADEDYRRMVLREE